jgi:hypothetical protein
VFNGFLDFFGYRIFRQTHETYVRRNQEHSLLWQIDETSENGYVMGESWENHEI